MSRKLEVEIIGDASSLERAFGRASKSGGALGNSLRSLGKVAAVGVGAAFAGLAVSLKVGFDELSEGQKVAAQTNAVLKSTGGIANVTAKDVDKLAQSLSRMSGIDDELVQRSENLLLTFKNVRNELGAGNAVFDRATKSALDLSVAGFGSVESASKMMGKALNDPIKGMTALGRAGVTFSEDQKKAIKSMVETGDLLGAQKLILKEVESQVGGSAKAYGETLPGQLAKLKNSFEEVAGGVAETLLPYLTQLLDWVNRNMPTIQKVIQTSLNAVVAAITFIAPIISTLIGWFQRLAAFAQRHWGEVQAAADRVVRWYQGTLQPAIQNVLIAIQAFWDRFGAAITRIVKTYFGVVLTIVKTILGNLGSIIEGILAVLRGDWGKAWDEFKEIPRRSLTAAIAIIKGLASNFLTAAKALGSALIDGIVAGLSGLADMVYEKIKGGISSAIDKVKGFFGISSPSTYTAAQLGIPLGEGVTEGLNKALATMPQAMRDKVTAGIDAAIAAVSARRGAFSQAADALVSAALSAFDRLSSEIETKAEKKLRLMDERQRKQQIGDDIKSANAALAQAQSAQASLKPEDFASTDDYLAAVVAAGQAVKDAEKQKDDALLAQQRYRLEQQAARERAALDERRALQRRKLEEQLADANSAYERGAISLQQYNQRLVAIMKKYHIPWKEGANALGLSLAAGLNDAWKEVQKAAKRLAETIVTELSTIRVVIGVNVSHSDNTPGRQHGGPVRAGSPYVVGEAGPELFIPKQSGQIVPNERISAARSSGGDSITVNVGGSVISERDLMDAIYTGLLQKQRRIGALGFS